MSYYKKPNGIIIEYDPLNHDESSLKERFEECDKDGNKIEKKAKPKAKKKK